MSWQTILKKPFIPNNQLVKTLVEMQRAHPNIFRENRNINDPFQMADDMLDDLKSHSHYGSAMELDRLEQSLLNIQQGFRRLEVLA